MQLMHIHEKYTERGVVVKRDQIILHSSPSDDAQRWRVWLVGMYESHDYIITITIIAIIITISKATRMQRYDGLNETRDQI